MPLAIAAYWFVKIVSGFLVVVVFINTLNSQTNESKLSLNNSAAPKTIVCMWWFVPLIREKYISGLFVLKSGVKTDNISKASIIGHV
jgi:hypothetical protein